MTLLVDAVDRYPVVVALVAIALVAYAADWFVGRAERDVVEAPRR